MVKVRENQEKNITVTVDIGKDNDLYTSLSRELMLDFTYITHPAIMQYGVNVIKQLRKFGNDEARAKEYVDDILGNS